MEKADYYQPARQYKQSKIRCPQCQRQLGKEVFKCEQRPFNCPYEVHTFRSYNWRMFIVHFMIALFIATCSLAFIVVYIIDGDNLPTVCALPLLGIAVLVFKEPVTRLLTGFNQKVLLNRKTGEKWQRLPGSETCYRPVAFMPDSVENPPQPKRPLSYPASSVALYDQKVYVAWQAGGTDYQADQIGYVMLATLLH